MKTYLCYIHRSHGTVADLTVIDCANDSGVPAAVEKIIDNWPRCTLIEVFDGQRPVHSRKVAEVTSQEDAKP